MSYLQFSRYIHHVLFIFSVIYILKCTFPFLTLINNSMKTNVIVKILLQSSVLFCFHCIRLYQHSTLFKGGVFLSMYSYTYSVYILIYSIYSILVYSIM